MNKKICIVYTHHKLGDLIWQLPYIKAISDHHHEKIDLIVRKKTQAQNIFADIKHINKIFYNDFRKGINYWIDVFKLMKIYFQNKYDYVYILDKVNKPAIAAKFVGVKNIIGPGIGNQKKWLTSKNFLTDEDWKETYSEQSQKFLKINSIQINNPYPEIEINTSRFDEMNSDLLIKGKKIAFGIDSFEDYKMWYEEDFVELANLLYEKKLFDYIYLICGPEKSYIADKIINLSKRKFFINCSQKDLMGVILALKNSDFFVGNNSGPLNLAAALKIKSFGLIANDPINELKFSKIKILRPDDLPDEYRLRDRMGMKKLKPKDVFEMIVKNL
jgi:heptosyltransferase-2